MHQENLLMRQKESLGNKQQQQQQPPKHYSWYNQH